MDNCRFQDHAAVVTGIGAAIAERLAAEGASVLIADINPEGTEEGAARIQANDTTADYPAV